ncbi:hypothetical protein ACRALDRAFT_2061318 [Sodiomyces alcalophilus JCM 7366]|uniref:uncharacterized protein n=1 Tax=Sodiomyces alcalophilus JCM 7366 TaxID=591952 RepID=UPI0039B63B74
MFLSSDSFTADRQGDMHPSVIVGRRPVHEGTRCHIRRQTESPSTDAGRTTGRDTVRGRVLMFMVKRIATLVLTERMTKAGPLDDRAYKPLVFDAGLGWLPPHLVW